MSQRPSARFFERQDWTALAVALALDVPLTFLGYGSDNDTFMALDSGRLLLERHRYVPSRNPGYFAYELTTGLLSRLGGSLLTNWGTLVVSLGIVALFLRICRRFDVPHRGWLATIMIVQPYFWSASTCTMDYNWAIFFLMAGFVCLLNDRRIPAGALLGLAIGMRLSSFIGAGVFLGHAWISDRDSRRRTAVAGAITAAIGAALYWPPFRWAGYTLKFIEPGIGGDEFWTPMLRLGRWVYKNVYFWGLPATITLAALTVLATRNWRAFRNGNSLSITLISLAMIAGYEALYLKYPIQPDYLLPMLPFALLPLGIACRGRPGWLATLLVAVALGAAARFNVAQPIIRGVGAVGARYGLWLEESFFIYELRFRSRLKHCDSFDCWRQTPRPEPLGIKIFELGAMRPSDPDPPPTGPAPLPSPSNGAASGR